MRRALDALRQTPQTALIDGNRLPPDLPFDGRTVIQGGAGGRWLPWMKSPCPLCRAKRLRALISQLDKGSQVDLEGHTVSPNLN